MAGRECYHCRQWVEDPKSHDCWTTTEEKLTADLVEDLVEAYERLRETAVSFGEQRIYASHKSIMFSRKACYFFVRPHKARLEVIFFVGKTIKHPLIRKTAPVSKTKVSHLIHVTHRDEVESPITDWLAEAYAYGAEIPKARAAKKKTVAKKTKKKKIAVKKAKAKPKKKAKKKPK